MRHHGPAHREALRADQARGAVVRDLTPLRLPSLAMLAAPEKVTGGIYRSLAAAGHPHPADHPQRGGRAAVHVHIVVLADRVSLVYRQLG